MADVTQPVTPVEAFIYTTKAALAAVAAYLLCNEIAPTAEVWAAVTAMIVIQPFLQVSWKTSLVRVAANIIAAVIGGVLNALFGMGLVALVLGIILVGLVCHFTKLDEGLRAAYAAVAILTLTTLGVGWHGPVNRVLAVLLGCLCALLINLLFDRLSVRITRKIDRPLKRGGHSE